MAEFIPFLMFLAACLVLMAGYPVAFSLAGGALGDDGYSKAREKLERPVLSRVRPRS